MFILVIILIGHLLKKNKKKKCTNNNKEIYNDKYKHTRDRLFLKIYSDSQCCWKKYSDFGGGKKNNLIQSFCHITFDKKNKYSNSRVVRKKNSERNKKP